ncbi:MAG TPA: hypothetical protein VEB86_18545 [Chryseosolibacter sp.]|nr:hypothetical protein [Chryseosolibacter sp.]
MRQEKFITLTIVTGFTVQFLCYVIALLFFPPDFSGEFPAYSQESNLIVEFGLALNMASATVMGIKLGDERKILAAAGFTMFAIAIGLSMSSLFEVFDVIDKASFEKSYFINTCSNFLYVPAILLIATFDGFKKWIHYVSIFTALVIFTSGVLFMFYYRNYIVLDMFTMAGYLLLSFTQLMWALNVYTNYRLRVGNSSVMES